MKRFFAKYITPIIVITVFSSHAVSLELSGISGGGNYNVIGKSYAERKFSTIYKQQYDFSCGSAALASLLTFHYDDEVNEQSVFIDMFQNGDQEKIKKQGFSLLDMKNYLERQGYRADGFKIKLDQLLTVNSPAITIINTKGYLHFVIIQGLDTQRVLVGDPAIGVNIIPRDKFEKIWGNRILFLIHAKEGIKARNFQNDEEWANRVAPLGVSVNRASLSEYNMLQRPGAFDF